MPHNILMQNLPKVPSQLRNQQHHNPWANLLKRSLAAADNAQASVVELVYTQDLKSCAARIEGSSPSTRTIFIS